jgi:DNA helicase-2/ATP-dependent DNA helicase PcrA
MRRLGVRSAGEVPAAYAVGDRVEHARFGAGTVRAVEALAADRKLTVAFDNHGEKTLLARFAKLTRL